jgi:sugar lactone lactonase YvrE
MDRQVLIKGLAFAEGPRWRNGRLIFSDVPAGQVLSLGLDGSVETVAEIDGGPSGLGWLPDGTLLVARGQPAQVLAVGGDGEARIHADLSGLTAYPCNDMVVDSRGRAFVGACDLAGVPSGAPALSELFMVEPDGAVTVVDREMRFPNGPVVTPDGATLIVAETFGQGLCAFDLSDEGASGKRQWATVAGSLPDGICLDAEGAVWFADPVANAAVRVREGGEVVQRVETETGCFACTLGGDDMRTLFLLTGRLSDPRRNLAERPGRIEAVQVDVPGTGSP